MEALFLSTPRGPRFCVLHTPAGLCKGAIVYVPPWAEEMNRSRRIAALQAKSWALAGFAVLLPDVGGSGDSEGEFADATWQDWVQDICDAQVWLAAKLQKMADGAVVPQWLWGLRAGCLLAAEVARQGGQAAQLLFWQPVVSGSLHLTQYLRLQSAASLVQGKTGNSPGVLRQILKAGQTVEVGGYAIAPGLAAGMDAAHLDDLPAHSKVQCWFASDGPSTTLPPVLEQQLARWRSAGVQAQEFAVSAPAFWQLQEVGDAPGLRAACLAQFEGTMA